MKIALFGATGGVGHHILEQALAQGHIVKSLVRTPSKLVVQPPELTVIQGNVLDPEKVNESVGGVDAVICALGNTPNNPDTVVSDGTRHIIQAMKQQGIRRLIVVTSLGLGDSKNQVPFIFKVLMRSILRKTMADKEVQEKVVKESGLDWIIVRPGGLSDMPPTGNYITGLDPSIIARQISRADVAGFVLQQLTDDTYLHKTPAVT